MPADPTTRLHAALRRAEERGHAELLSGTPLPESARAQISFTYTLLSGWGLVRNPWIAVWIENTAGDLVKVVAAYDLDGVHSMAQWYAVLGTTETTTSSTKPAGTNSTEWDMTDHAGRRVSSGQYFVCLEASRDMGPREFIRGRVFLDETAATFYLPSSGELAAAAVIYTV